MLLGWVVGDGILQIHRDLICRKSMKKEQTNITNYGAWKVPRKSMVFLDKLIRGAYDHPIKLPSIRGSSEEDGEMLKMTHMGEVMELHHDFKDFKGQRC